MKKAAIILMIVVLAVSFASCFSIADKDKTNKIEDITTKPATTATATPTAAAKTFAKVGQKVTGETWAISLLYAKQYSSIDGDYYSDKPGNGKVYLVLFFEVENVSNKSDYFNTLYFKSYVDDYSISSSMILNDPDDFDSIFGDIAAGKKLKGCIAYEVPSNWSSFEITYDDGILSSNEVAAFKIATSDLTK